MEYVEKLLYLHIIGKEQYTPIQIAILAIGIVVNLIAYYIYLKDISTGTVKPHTFSWLVWMITQGIGVYAQWRGDGGLGAISLTIGEVFVFIVFLISLFRGTRNATKADKILLVCALSAIVVWRLTSNLLLAAWIVSIADICGAVPSFKKAFRNPQSESVLTWIFFIVSGICSMLVLKNYNPLTLTYPLALMTINVIMVAICILRRVN